MDTREIVCIVQMLIFLNGAQVSTSVNTAPVTMTDWTTKYWQLATVLRMDRTTGLSRTPGQPSGEKKDIFVWPGIRTTIVVSPLMPPSP